MINLMPESSDPSPTETPPSHQVKVNPFKRYLIPSIILIILAFSSGAMLILNSNTTDGTKLAPKGSNVSSKDKTASKSAQESTISASEEKTKEEKTETEDKLRYFDSNFGNLEFKYPKDWTLSSRTSSSKYKDLLTSPGSSGQYQSFFYVTKGSAVYLSNDVSGIPTNTSKSFFDLVKENYPGTDYRSTTDTYKSISVDGTDAVRYDGHYMFDASQNKFVIKSDFLTTQYLIRHSGKTYRFFRQYLENERSKYETEFEDMIESVNFLD